MRSLLPCLLIVSAVSAVAPAPAATPAAVEPPPPEYDTTRELIQLVSAAAELVAEVGPEAACEEFEVEGSPWFQGETYVFILNWEGTALCHPAQPALEGKGLLNMHDPHGKPIVQTFLRELEGESEEAWVHYLWPRPDQMTFFWKTSYVQEVSHEGRDYVVGSGLYEMEMERFFVVEQVNDAVRLIREEGREAFDTFRRKSTGFLFYDAYVFVMDEGGNMLVNVGFPDLEGTHVLDLQDVDGKYMVREMIQGAREHDAVWVDYKWPKPGDSRPSEKSSYVRRIEGDGEVFLVGAGVYF